MSLHLVTGEPDHDPDNSEVAMRGLTAGLRRYTAAPDERAQAAKRMLESAVFLLASHTSAKEAAKVALRALTAALGRRGPSVG